MNMELRTLAERLGIAEYPEELNEIYGAVRNGAPIGGITETLTALEKDYAPFDKYYDFLMRAAEEILADEALHLWLTLGVAYCKNAGEKEAARFPLPPSNETLARDLFPAILIAMEYPETIKRYRAYGFDEAQIKKNLGNLGINLSVHELTQGRVALSAGLYAWMVHYAKARIFDHAGFNFQASKWGDETILLKNKESGALAFLMLKGSFAADGRVAGIRGAEDVPALFDAAVEETEDAFFGYRAQNQRVHTERECFPKSEWEAVLRPCDDVISFHLPRGTNLTPDHVERAMAEGEALARRFYTDCDFKQIVCISWMLDPKLLDILPEHSNISQFIRHFILHPSGETAGVAGMGYVWPGVNCPIEELPENTSLQRGIKSMMLGGKYLFWTAGVWVKK